MNEQFAAEDDIKARTMTDSEVNELSFAEDLAYALIGAVQGICQHYKQDQSDIMAQIFNADLVRNLGHEAEAAFQRRIKSALSGDLTPRQQEAIKALMVAA